MSSLRDEIAEEFDNCMGYHEGIKVPDHEDGYRSIDFAVTVIKIIEIRIDERIKQIEPCLVDEARNDKLYELRRLKEMLK